MNDDLTVASFFSGIGLLDLGLEWAGWRTVSFAEIDPYASRVLEARFPGVPNLGDIHRIESVPDATLWAGGFPCQPISNAGKRLGQADARWLWPAWARLIRQFRPRYLLLENVAALLGRGLGDVLGDLAALGYDAEWDCIPAAALGAPHLRDRIWIIAYRQGDAPRPDSNGERPHRTPLNEYGGPELRHEQERLVGQVGGPVAYAQGDGLPIGGAGNQGRDADSTSGKLLRAQPLRSGADGREGTAPDADGSGQQPWQRDVHAGQSDALGSGTELADASGGDGGSRGQGRPEHGRQGLPVHAHDLAHANGTGRRRTGTVFAGTTSGARALRGAAGSGWWATEPGLGRVANGVPHRVDRLRCLGNGVVPQVTEWIGYRLRENIVSGL